MDSTLQPFVVVKFVVDQGTSNEEICYEVAPTKWCTVIDDDTMTASIRWPKDNSKAGTLARREQDSDPSWALWDDVKIVRYSGTYAKGAEVAKGFTENSNYETDHGIPVEMGRGKRRKVVKQISSSESEGEDRVKDVAAPPLIKLPSSFKSSKSTGATIKVTSKGTLKKKPKEVAAPLTKQEKMQKLKDKILGERKKALAKQEERRLKINLKPPSPSEPGKFVKSPLKITVRNAQAGTSSQRLRTTPEKSPLKISSRKSPAQSQRDVVSFSPSSRFSVSPLNVSQSSVFKSSDRDRNILSPRDENNNGNISFGNDFDEENLTDKQRSTPKSKKQGSTPKKDERELISSNSALDESVVKNSSASSHVVRHLFKPTKSINLSGLQENTKSEEFLHKCLTRIENRMEDINGKLDVLIMNQAKVSRALMPHEKRVQRPTNLPSLPVSSITKFEVFEKFLDDPANLSAASYYFSSFPLPREDGAIPKLMPHLLYNCVAKYFNFDGHGAKKSFKATKMWDAIQGALVLKYEYSDLERSTKELRSWLRNALGRKQEDQ